VNTKHHSRDYRKVEEGNLDKRDHIRRGLVAAAATLLGENAVLAVVAFFSLSSFLRSPVGYAIDCFIFAGLGYVNTASLKPPIITRCESLAHPIREASARRNYLLDIHQ
jgi:hypothetical protein